MARPSNGRVRKNYRLQPDALARAQAALGTKNETDTIELALRIVVGESQAPQVPDMADRTATGHGILRLFGSIPPHEADEMLRVIEEDCERIDDEPPPRFPD